MNPVTTSGIILLDRDGVLNSMVIDADHGTIDSPLHPSQVKIYKWTADALALLNSKNYGLAIVTNQPSAAKGKTTKENLEKVHQLIVEQAELKGGKILSSHICFHRAEDHCACRKPKTGLLEDALKKNPSFSLNHSW
jgi:histidinol-phosphate phosphatase family protein